MLINRFLLVNRDVVLIVTLEHDLENLPLK
jgi:hypothetical protein